MRLRAPRLALLTAIIVNPILFVAYILFIWDPFHRCFAPAICNATQSAVLLQALALVGLYAVVWFLLYLFGQERIEGPSASRGPVSSLFAWVSAFESMRELFTLLAVIIGLLMIVAALEGKATLLGMGAGLFTSFVCVYCAASRPAQASRDPLGQLGSPTNRLRRLLPGTPFAPQAGQSKGNQSRATRGASRPNVPPAP